MKKEKPHKPLLKPVKKSNSQKGKKLTKKKPKKKKGNKNSAEKQLNNVEFVSIKDFAVVKTESERVTKTVSMTIKRAVMKSCHNLVLLIVLF